MRDPFGNVGLRKVPPQKEVGNSFCSSPDVVTAVSILSKLKASVFCSQYLQYKTSTFTTTSTKINVRTSTITSTSATQAVVTSYATLTATAFSTTTLLNTVTVTPPGILGTLTQTDTTTATATVTTTSLSTICIGGGVMKREALPTSPNLEARTNIPKELIRYAEAVLKTACGCFVLAPTVTKTVSATAASTSKTTKVIASTGTSTITATVSFTTTIPTTNTVATTTDLPAAMGSTTITTTQNVSSTTTATVTTTTNIIKVYTQAFSGNNCIYNGFFAFYPLQAPSFLDAQHQCACNCNKNARCKSFFIYYAPPGGPSSEGYACTLDEVPFDPASAPCNVIFAAQGKGYNQNA